MSIVQDAQEGCFSKIFNALNQNDRDALATCINRRRDQRNRAGDAVLLTNAFRDMALDLIGRLNGQNIFYEGRRAALNLTFRDAALTLGIVSENRETRFSYTPRWVRSEQNVYIDVARTTFENGQPGEENGQTLALGRKDAFADEVRDALESVYAHIAAQLIPDRNIATLSRLAPDSFSPNGATAKEWGL